MRGRSAPVDFHRQGAAGKCPKCGARVFDAGMNYICEKSVGADRACTFRTGRSSCSRKFTGAGEEIARRRGKTEFADRNFISKEKQPAFKGIPDRQGWAARRLNFRRGRRRAGRGRPKARRSLLPKIDFTGKESLRQMSQVRRKDF